MKKQNNYGKILLKPNNNLFLLFMLSVFSQIGGSGLIIVLAIEMFKYDSSGSMSSLLNVIFLFGTSLVGLFGSMLLKKYKGFVIGFIAPMLSLLLVILFIYTRGQSPTIFYIFAFLLAVTTGFELPNNNSTIPLLIKEKENINKAFSTYQTTEQAFLITLPIIINFLLLHYSFNFVYWIFALFYLIGALPWIQLRNSLIEEKVDTNQEKSNKWKLIFEGYYKVYKNKNLLFLNLNRIFNNMIFSVIAVALPFFIGFISDGNLNITSYLRNYYSSLTSLAFVIIGLIFTFKFLKKPQAITIMAFLTPLIALVGYNFFYFFKTEISFFFLAICIGIGQYLGRISMISMGQKLTPQKDLALTILAGDTVTRIMTLIINASAVALLSINQGYIFNITFCFLIVGLLGLLTLIIPTKNYIRTVNENKSDKRKVL